MNRKMTAILAAHAIVMSSAVAFAMELGMYLGKSIRPSPQAWIGLAGAVLASVALAAMHVWPVKEVKLEGDSPGRVAGSEE